MMTRRAAFRAASAIGLAASGVSAAACAAEADQTAQTGPAADAPEPLVKDGANWRVSSAPSRRVDFRNYFGMRLAGTLFVPPGMDPKTKHPGVVISHPFAAVRQQSALLYAGKIAEAGIPALAFDQSFWGSAQRAVKKSSRILAQASTAESLA